MTKLKGKWKNWKNTKFISGKTFRIFAIWFLKESDEHPRRKVGIGYMTVGIDDSQKLAKKKKILVKKRSISLWSKEKPLVLIKWEGILNYAHGRVDEGEVKYSLIHVGSERIN